MLVAIRKGKYDKPSKIVRNFNPAVERLIARALRVDRKKRWQSAEQMGDRIDAILAKLGTPTGSAALKRWLAELGERDGVLPPSETMEPPPTATIELGSGDIELEEVSPPNASLREAREPPAAPTSKKHSRLRRFFVRLVAIVVTLTLLGIALYFGRRYLPPRIVQPLDSWIHEHVH